jgi:hypothetical protein
MKHHQGRAARHAPLNREVDDDLLARDTSSSNAAIGDK